MGTTRVAPAGPGTAPAGPSEAGDKGLPDLAKRTVSDLVRLAKLEVQLVLEDVKSRASQKGKFVAIGAVGGVLLLFGLGFLLASAASALSIVLPRWLALLLVALAVIVVGGLLLAITAKNLRSGQLVSASTTQKVKEDVQWVQDQSS